jgi:hypothetical protein
MLKFSKNIFLVRKKNQWNIWEYIICWNHTVVAYDYGGLHLGSTCTPWRSAAQVCNEQGLLGHASRVQGFGEDKVGPGRGLHARVASTQLRVVAVVQGGQGSR